MHKRIAICVFAILLTILFAGCGEVEKIPDGVIRKDGGDWYIVKLPSGKSVGDYFDLTGNTGYVHMTNMGHMDKNESMGGANYCQVSEGGWVIFTGDVFMYIPYEISSDAAMTACTTLILNRDNYMSMEQAKQYISFLE